MSEHVEERVPSKGEVVVGAMLEASHRMAPDDVASAVSEALTALGMADPVIYVVDLDQRTLVPLSTGEGSPAEPLDIDQTLAGASFRTEQVLDEPAPDGTAVRVWLPLLDGADRVGVLAVTVDHADRVTVDRARHLASITAHLVVSKSAFGDHIVLARRRRHTDLAAELRWSMLPPLSYTNDRVAIAGMLEPAYEIAGDAFDYAVNGDLAHVAILDAMGHGLEASRMANLAVGSYRHSRRMGLGLEDTFVAIDAVVASQFGAERFVTGQLGRLKLSTGELRWVNAGHPHPLVWRGDRPLEELRCETSLPMGLGSHPAGVATIALEPGDAVLFMTDGVIEARSPEGKLFGRTRLARLWHEARLAGGPPAETLRILCHSVLDHQNGQLQDDATLLLVVWTANS